jgi:hypothetical protein
MTRWKGFPRKLLYLNFKVLSWHSPVGTGFCINVFGKNLDLVAVKVFSYLIYFTFCTFNRI